MKYEIVVGAASCRESLAHQPAIRGWKPLLRAYRYCRTIDEFLWDSSELDLNVGNGLIPAATDEGRQSNGIIRATACGPKQPPAVRVNPTANLYSLIETAGANKLGSLHCPTNVCSGRPQPVPHK